MQAAVSSKGIASGMLPPAFKVKLKKIQKHEKELLNIGCHRLDVHDAPNLLGLSG